MAALTQKLDNLDNDLATAEESMLSRMRSPLSRTDPATDLANRLREQEVTSYLHTSPLPTHSSLSVSARTLIDVPLSF